MTSEKILKVIETYRKLFVERGIGKIDYPHDHLLDRAEVGLSHCHGMLDQMVEFAREGRLDKAFCWLGFVQGVLWVNGIYTLTELKDHNRPDNTNIHILLYGRPVCGFSSKTPNLWPTGHSWVGPDDKDKATCPACKSRIGGQEKT